MAAVMQDRELERQRALAMARARMRSQQQQASQAEPAQPPQGFYRAEDNQLHLNMTDMPRQSFTRTIGRGVTDMARGAVEMAPQALQFLGGTPAQMTQPYAERVANNIPEVDAANPWEEAGAAAIQFGVPGIAGARAGSVATQGLPRAAQAVGQGLGVAAADFVATDPDDPETLGDIVPGAPTAINSDDSDMVRRAKVAGETLAMAGAGQAVGPAINRASGMVRGGVDEMASWARNIGRNPRSLDNMREAAAQAYRAVDDAGIRYSEDAANRMMSNIRSRVASDNIDDLRHPIASRTVQRLDNLRQFKPTLTQLDQMRQVVRRDLANHADDAEAHFGRIIIDEIDNFIDDATRQSDVVAGNASQAGELIRNARGLHRQRRTAEMVEEAIDRAAQRAASTGSGGNVENAIRQNLRQLVDPKSKTNRFFTDAERQAIRRVVEGDPVQNVLRLVGKLSPSGNGLMTFLSGGTGVAGLASGNPALMAIPAAGYVAKQAGLARQQGALRNLEQVMREGTTRAVPRGLFGSSRATVTPLTSPVIQEEASRRSARVPTR